MLRVVRARQSGKETVLHPESRRLCTPQAASTLETVPLWLDLLSWVQMYSVQSAHSKAQPWAFYHKLLNSIWRQYHIMPLICREWWLNVSPWIGAHEQRRGAVCGGAGDSGCVLRQGSLSQAWNPLYTHGSLGLLWHKLLNQGEHSPLLFLPASQREELMGS